MPRQRNLFQYVSRDYRGPAGEQVIVPLQVRNELRLIIAIHTHKIRCLAEDIGVSRSTLDKALAGVTSTQTMEKIRCYLKENEKLVTDKSVLKL